MAAPTWIPGLTGQYYDDGNGNIWNANGSGINGVDARLVGSYAGVVAYCAAHPGFLPAALCQYVNGMLPSTTGSLSITSTPAGAEIFIDGADQGLKTPNTVTGISAGSHTVLLRLSGYADYTQAVTITAGTTTPVAASLTAGQTTGGITMWTIRGRLGLKGTVTIDPSGTYLVWNIITAKGAAINVAYGSATDIPLVGDWNGDGIEGIGVYAPSTGDFWLQNNIVGGTTSDYAFQYGPPNTTPITWYDVAMGNDSIGVIMSEQYYLNNHLTPGNASIVVPASAMNCPGSGIVGQCLYTPVSGSTTGSLSITSTPAGAEIFIDGADQGTKTPNTVTGILAGNHTVLLRLSGYDDYTQAVNITAGTATPVAATLTPATVTPATGSLSITSTPAGAEIFIDGADQSLKAPATVTNVPAGSHVLTLTLSGYASYVQTINVVAGTTTPVTATLTPTTPAPPAPTKAPISAGTIAGILGAAFAVLVIGYAVTRPSSPQAPAPRRV